MYKHEKPVIEFEKITTPIGKLLNQHRLVVNGKYIGIVGKKAPSYSNYVFRCKCGVRGGKFEIAGNYWSAEDWSKRQFKSIIEICMFVTTSINNRRTTKKELNNDC